MEKYIKYLTALVLIAFCSCQEKAPSETEGNANIKLVVLWDNAGQISSVPNAKVVLVSEYGTKILYADSNGILELNHLPSATYSVSVRANLESSSKVMLVGNKININMLSGINLTDTVFVKAISSSGVALNEIYSCGPNSVTRYYYDLFFELYNSSDETIYVDGWMIMRVSGNGDGKGPGADEGDDGDLDGINQAYKFPGNPGEKNYPFKPHTYMVLATMAIDHNKVVSESIDLSHADWEFFNQYRVGDTDNPDVPNLINMWPEKTTKFLVGMTGDVILLSDGRDTNFQDGVDTNTILDGVQYSGNIAKKKTLSDEVDQGVVYAPPLYSGKSMQRIEPGVDTNNGKVDWMILDKPTPGY